MCTWWLFGGVRVLDICGRGFEIVKKLSVDIDLTIIEKAENVLCPRSASTEVLQQKCFNRNAST